jgi:hypothetical protein
MDIGILTLLLGVWVVLLAGASIVTLLPAARPGHEGDVLPLTLRRRRETDKRPAA